MYIKNVQKGEHYMKQVTVRLDEEMHKAGKIRAIMQNKSFMQYVVDLIKKDLDNKKEQSR
jgi:predicted HicB family RNase H-like nuclease